MDVARTAATEAELTRLIEKRAREGDPEAEHELWKASVRRYNLARTQERRARRPRRRTLRAAAIADRLGGLMIFFKSRLRRLEARAGQGDPPPCPECGLAPGDFGHRVFHVNEGIFGSPPEPEFCRRCGERLWFTIELAPPGEAENYLGGGW